MLSVEEIVEGGLCIGCGLCASVAGPGRIDMVMTDAGRQRPLVRRRLEPATVARINAVCPGTRVEGGDPARLPPQARVDRFWGPVARVAKGHASDPQVRYEASSGGVLTALARFLLDSGRVDYVLHVAASRDAPMRSKPHLSFDRVAVLQGAGSRYGPVPPLMNFMELLDRGQPFAFVGKPCDVNAVRNLARLDPRVDEQMRCALAMVCGGASELGKSEEVIRDLGVAEDELALFRYRGHGNPGPTRVRTRDGRTYDLTYAEMWEDESRWRIQSRCKICPDAIGEAADIVAGDVWPNASPTGDDPGFNSIIVRTSTGLELFDAAVAAGALTICGDVPVRQLDVFNPHQVAKKKALWARHLGLRALGRPVPEVRRLRLRRMARTSSLRENVAEFKGTVRRARDGRLSEQSPVPRG